MKIEKQIKKIDNDNRLKSTYIINNHLSLIACMTTKPHYIINTKNLRMLT